MKTTKYILMNNSEQKWDREIQSVNAILEKKIFILFINMHLSVCPFEVNGSECSG